MRRHGLRPSLALLRLALSPEPDGHSDGRRDHEKGHNDSGGYGALGKSTRLGGGDIVEDPVGRSGSGDFRSVGLDVASLRHGGKHGRFRVRDGKDGSDGRNRVPRFGASGHDAQLQVGRRGRVPPFWAELHLKLARGEVGVLPDLDDARTRLIEVEVDSRGGDGTRGVPFKLNGLGRVDGRASRGGCVQFTGRKVAGCEVRSVTITRVESRVVNAV